MRVGLAPGHQPICCLAQPGHLGMLECRGPTTRMLLPLPLLGTPLRELLGLPLGPPQLELAIDCDNLRRGARATSKSGKAT